LASTAVFCGSLRSTIPSIRRARFTFLLVSGALAMAFAHVEAADSPARPGLTADQEAAIARAFAPILVFHPLEHYFPISSMLRLGADNAQSLAEPVNGDDQAALRAGPETWPSRVAGYRNLSLEEKLQRAALGYRVFSRVDRGQIETVVEYWCYYVYNEFTVRGTWLPYRVRDNHPHDLERLYLVLTPNQTASSVDAVADEAWARGAFRIRSVVANAHDGSIPPNEYDVADDDVLAAPLTVLIERGSHAMALDVNQDGRFTPGIDSTDAPKLQWGIRDTGATGSRYRASFMDNRDASAPRLCGPPEEGRVELDACPRYTLYPADDLQTWFLGFELSPRERQDVLGQSPWWVRTFGDVRLETLMVPSDPPDGSVLDAMVRRRIRGQTGLVAGITAAANSPAVIVGQRYFWNVGPRRAPDVAAEAVALFSVGRRPLMEATLWGSYTIDAITNVVIGGGWFSERQIADIAAGTDLRLGRFSVRPIWRVRERVFNARITTTF
jgi:hypothetical protein